MVGAVVEGPQDGQQGGLHAPGRAMEHPSKQAPLSLSSCLPPACLPGKDATLPQRCPACAAVLSAAGPKWQLLWQLTQRQEWAALSAGRKAIMVPDDDLHMSTCDINRRAWGVLGV